MRRQIWILSVSRKAASPFLSLTRPAISQGQGSEVKGVSVLLNGLRLGRRCQLFHLHFHLGLAMLLDQIPPREAQSAPSHGSRQTRRLEPGQQANGTGEHAAQQGPRYRQHGQLVANSLDTQETQREILLSCYSNV